MPRSARSRATALLALVAAACIGLTGCQVGGAHGGSRDDAAIELPPLSDLTPLEDPTSYEGPTSAVIGGPSIEPIADSPDTELPVTVTSHDRTGDVEVEVTDTSRVLALSLTGTLAELVYSYGLEDQLVGRDISTGFPGSEDLPLVTKDGHSLDAEGILSLDPTLIITDGSLGNEVLLQMRDAGVPVVITPRPVDAESTYDVARQVAEAMGVAPLGDELVAVIDEAIAAKEEEIQALIPDDEGKRPRVAFLYVRGQAGIFYLFGEGSGIDTMIDSVGAIDVADEIGWIGEKPVTEEALVDLNPDVILVMTKGLDSAGGIDGLLEAHEGIRLTTAGQNQRIIDVDDTTLFAGGTRLPDVIDGLARAIYAPDSLADTAAE